MIDTVYNILEPLNIPIQFMLRPKIDSTSKIGISYHFFNEGYELHGDGKGQEFGGSVQIDIFSLIDYADIVKQAINLMESNGFRLAPGGVRDSDDSLNSTQYYHKILIFNYSEKEVIKSGI
mgnify:CR=1 FL=1